MPLPIRIDPCPIIQAGYEVRFVSDAPAGAVFGLVYHHLEEEEGATILELPALRLPSQLREHDEGLAYQPHYQIDWDDFAVQIGPRVMVIACQLPYPGWGEFSQKIRSVVDALITSEVAQSIERVGLRYVNLFDGDVLDQLKVNIDTDAGYTPHSLSLRMQMERNGFMNSIGILDKNAAALMAFEKAGTVVDIDTFYKAESLAATEWSFAKQLEEMHHTEKEIFYSLLSDDLLNKLNPEYVID